MESHSTAAAEPSSRLRAWRRLAGLILMFLLCLPPHLVARAAGRSPWPRRFLRGVAWISGVDVRCDGRAASGGTLLLANHVNWLDIPILAGTTGCAFVAKADADGYTLLAHSSAHTIAPALYPRLSYHPSRDLVAVAALGMSPFILVVPPNRGFQAVGDLVAAAKSKPGTFSFASVGFGSASHLSAERFMFSAGLKAAHVAFKGGAEAVVEVMTGRIDFFFVAAGAALSNVREGTLKALAVNSRERLSSLPDVPTLDEAGLSNAENPSWFGLFAPAGTPPEIVGRLNREIRAVLQQPKVKDKLAALGVAPMDLASAKFSALVERDIALDAALVKAIGLKPN